MTPPKRKPFFDDSTGNGAELTHPHTGAEMRWLLRRLAAAVEMDPRWHTDNEGQVAERVTLSILENAPELLRIAFASGTLAGVLTARPHPESGYVELVAERDGEVLFHAFIDHPWEEYGLYPPGDATPEHEEGPGRMGKRLTWVSLSTQAWPQLDPLSYGGRFNLIVDDR